MVTLVKRKLKTDLKAKITKRDNEGPFTVITGRINQENITILDMYAHNIYASKYVKKKTDRTEKKKKTDRTDRRNRQIHNTAENFNNPLSILDKTSRQKFARIY